MIGGLLMVVAVAVSAGDLGVARDALRDGLWKVARQHALAVTNATDESRQIVWESYARENNWRGLLDANISMGSPADCGSAYYRALALYNVGSVEEASNVVAGISAPSESFKLPLMKLKAELAAHGGHIDDALAILGKSAGSDVDIQLMTASLHEMKGDRRRAEELWRTVVANTNALAISRAQAAAKLGDVAELRKIASSSAKGAAARYAAVKLGVELISDDATFEEGVQLIRNAVHDYPDFSETPIAYMRLADCYAARRDFARAVGAYASIQRIWPKMVSDPKIHLGLGWALSGVGRKEEALAEFRQVEQLKGDDETKAEAAVRKADILLELGNRDEAMAAYRDVLKAYPAASVAARVRDFVKCRQIEDDGRALYGKMKFAEARRKFEELGRADRTKQDRVHYYCALCHYGEGDEESAVKIMRELERDSANRLVMLDAMHWMAKYEFNQRRWKEAGGRFLEYARGAASSDDAPAAYLWAARSAMSDGDLKRTVAVVTQLLESMPGSRECNEARLLQAEAMIALARFDEAIIVIEQAMISADFSPEQRQRALILRGDAMFAMGADDQQRYQAALDAYNAARAIAAQSPDIALAVAFKIARTLERMNRINESVDCCYTHVLLAFRDGCESGTFYRDESKAIFVRAAFQLADQFESRGMRRQAVNVLDLVRKSRLTAAVEADRRIRRIAEEEGEF